MLRTIPFACWSLWKILNNKETLKDSYKKTEEQNEVLTGHLVEIEKANENLQKKVEERTEELTGSNIEIQNENSRLKK